MLGDIQILAYFQLLKNRSTQVFAVSVCTIAKMNLRVKSYLQTD